MPLPSTSPICHTKAQFLFPLLVIISCYSPTSAFLSVRQKIDFYHHARTSAPIWPYPSIAPIKLIQRHSHNAVLSATRARPRGFASILRPRDSPRPSTDSSLINDVDNIPIKILSPSPNSRTIFGSIFIPGVSPDDVWAILTDYDRLSVHVPNLVESVRRNDDGGTPAGSGKNGAGCAGDGKYRCRLYQRGAQKIIGFTFGASVTMAMEEKLIEGYRPAAVSGLERGASGLGPVARNYIRDRRMFDHEEYGGKVVREILFKLVDSRFFGAFDGTWKVIYDPSVSTEGVMLEYEVFVKPNGPVPVAALEWRIKEDIPINLRAVKKVSIWLQLYL
mmetsp:Transcript_15543/g.34947  ORF Transcript_15543/g.34947 Transcript_15543/m.34947 type:complete len:333 (-) Transcript_15543:521-1519(-)